jgi:hypothetical protein
MKNDYLASKKERRGAQTQVKEKMLLTCKTREWSVARLRSHICINVLLKNKTLRLQFYWLWFIFLKFIEMIFKYILMNFFISMKKFH